MRRHLYCILVAAVTLLALAPAADARPGNLQVTQANRLVSASWTLPTGDSALSFQLSFQKDFPDDFGTFETQLSTRQTSTTLEELLPGGLYFVRIMSTPTPDLCAIGDPGCVTEFSDLGSVVVPSQAANLHTVTQVGGVVSAAWSLPTGVSTWSVDISTSANRNLFGFPQSVYSFDADLNITSFSFPAVPPGYYYVEVQTTPTTSECLNGRFAPGCVVELSNIVPVQATAGSPTGATPPPASVTGGDKVVSLGAVTASSSQKVDKLSITLNPGEAVGAKLSGTVSVPGGSKVYRFKSVSKSIGAGVKTKLSLKLPAKGKKAVKRALKRKKKLKAKLTLVITDAAGNAQTKKYTVRLKR